MEEYKKIPVGQAKDLTNQRFGLLTVLYRIEHKTKGSAWWLCQCDCGTIKPISSQHLTSGNTNSCGCLNRKKASERMLQYNLSKQTINIGDRFGKLTVIEYEGLRKQNSRDKRESWYICQCDCGSEPKPIRGNDLKIGAVTSCGCISSRGEFIIKQLLEKNNIQYKQQYSFPDLRNPKTRYNLFFDFAIFDKDENLQYLIEFDGRQHFDGPEAKWTHSSDLEDIQYRDLIKNEYCKKNNLILKRIPYTEIKNLTIENLQDNTFTF